MAKKTHFRFFCVGENEYIEIGDSIFQIIGRWGNAVLLLFNDKSKPTWSEAKISPEQIIDCSGGFYFVCFKTPKPIFLGNNSQGSLVKYFLWVMESLKLEAPIEVLSAIASDEIAHMSGKKRQYKSPLLTPICRVEWHLTQPNSPNKAENYAPGRSAYQLISPGGKLASKHPKAHLMVELNSTTLPPIQLIEPKIKDWIQEVTV